MVELLQRNHYQRTTIIRDLLGPRNMSNRHYTGGNLSVVLESKLEIFGSNRRVFVRRGVGERMISACGFPTYAEHLLAAFPSFTLWSNSSQTISIWLRSGDCGGQVIWCSIPSLSFLVKYPLRSLKVCVGSLSCWKTNDSANQMGWCIAAECCGSHAG